MRKRWLSRRLADFSLLFMLQMWKSGVRNPCCAHRAQNHFPHCREALHELNSNLDKSPAKKRNPDEHQISINVQSSGIFFLTAKFTTSHTLTQTPHSGFIEYRGCAHVRAVTATAPFSKAFTSQFLAACMNKPASLCRSSTPTNIKPIFSMGCWFLFKWIMYQPDRFFFHFTHVTNIFLTGIIPQWYYHKSKENQACKP